MPSRGTFLAGWFLLASLLSWVAEAQPAAASSTVTLSWKSNSEETLSGYRLYYGFRNRKYVRRVDVGNTNQFSLSLPLPARTYFFALTAYDKDGLESAFSDEVPYEAPTNAIPMARVTRKASVLEDGLLIVDIESDAGPRKSQWILSKDPDHGRIEVFGSQILYFPESDFEGPSDTFELVVGLETDGPTVQEWVLDIEPTNDPPSAIEAWLFSQAGEATPVRLEGLDPDGDTLQFQLVTLPALGSLTGTPPNLTYTARNDAEGTDTFTFVATDGVSTSTVAQVRIEVARSEIIPLAGDAFVTLLEDQPNSFILEAAKGPDITIEITTPPAFGSLSGIAPDLTYIPNPDFFGTDTMIFEVSNAAGRSDVAVVFFEVEGTPDPPQAEDQVVNTPFDTPITFTLSAYDPDQIPLRFEFFSGPLNGSLTGTPPQLHYAPNPGFVGKEIISYWVLDETNHSRVATAEIVVHPPTQIEKPSLHASLGLDGRIVLRWNALAGRRYEVVYQDSPASNLWTSASGPLIAEGTSMVWSTVLDPRSTSVFYAVRLLAP